MTKKLNSSAALAARGFASRLPVLLGLAVLLSGCANHTVNRSFDQLSQSVDRLALAVAPLDAPRDCGGTPPMSLNLDVRFNGSCPKEVVPVENGCVNQSSKNESGGIFKI